MIRIAEGGRCKPLATFRRFDVAERYAEIIAESLARNDHDRVIRRGTGCSGVRAIVTGWDVWEIDHNSSRPIVRAIKSTVPRQRILTEVGKLLDLKLSQDE